ncbi:DNA-binding protein [Polaribacter reichenbachii]|uniref:HTH LytTR-type domain-containing protein n=1 Tax=Polaribacter reichenbachii TaxID=996801 RepID=A0A1B8TUF1_9FLAO|nr:LytTR family DNA-binding domain-containing protein [Polaribacter reichenbachii]APZ45701.1 DNA-binding protein [Polaribacter reichenbachii]AUC19563.1 DNA-binding protein [Polaribacter reichenbachii]OBY63283.1 hypothetical protein LPB301_10675 [Polaribacter reichenbachii]
MIKPIIKLFKRKLNLEAYITNKLALTALHGAFVFIFLNLFKPFNLDVLKETLFGYSLVMGSLTFIVPYLLLLILDKTNYKKLSVASFLIVLFCFLWIYSYILWFFSGVYKDEFNLLKLSFVLFYKYSSSLALISILFFVIVNEKVIRFKRKIRVFTKKEKSIIIYSENNKENISIAIADLIYITIAGNYASFFVNTSKGIKEIVLRNTLSKILNQIQGYPYIFKCHKSFIVNTKHIKSISGNAKGYFLISDKIDIKIPVSRSIKKKEIEKFIL